MVSHVPPASRASRTLCPVRVVFSVLRYHWSALPLAAAALALLVVGAAVLKPSASTAMVGAGAALAGAAATRIIDLERERRAVAAQAAAIRQRDLDETRRLAYMALAGQGTRDYSLTATIVNALAHHQRAADPGEAMRHLVALAKAATPARARHGFAGTSAG